MPYVVDSAESAPPSLKSSPSKRERVRKFLRRVSSIGHRSHKHDRDQSLSQSSVAVSEAQAPGAVHAASSPEQHVIDLTVDPVPAKALRRESISSSTGSVLNKRTHHPSSLAAAVIDDASSFHSSAPSESSASELQSNNNDKQVPEPQPAENPHVEPEQLAADASAHEVVVEIPAVDEAPAVDPASIPLPPDEEEESNPVPPVFLAETAEDASTPLPDVEDVPAAAEAPTAIVDDGAAPSRELEVFYTETEASFVETYPKDPFDDAYAADTESVSSASPELAPTLVRDVIETIELNEPADAPAPVEPIVELEPQPEAAELSERAVEVVEIVEIITSETTDTAAPSPDPEPVQTPATAVVEPTEISTQEAPAAEQQTAAVEVEAVTEAPSTPASTVPYVVVVAPSPISPPEPALEAAPSVSKEVPLAPAPASSPASPAPAPAPSQPERSLAPLISWLHSGITALKVFMPARRTPIRWRTPMCYGIAVMCYSLTWYLARRPPVNVELSRFHMY